MGGAEAAQQPFHLNELQIGVVAWAFTLVIFGVMGLISVVSEGRELHVGRVAPRLTNLLSWAILVVAVLLFAIAVTLGVGIAFGWSTALIGLLAAAGCFILAMLLLFYKEAFVGDEASFDWRDDGVPW